MDDDDRANWHTQRETMIQNQLHARGISDVRVLDAMRVVPRHHFVPITHRADAYADTPLPIGDGQTISQPFIVGLMSQLLQLQGHERVLEIGTGCGYQTAVLCQLAKFVYSLERIENLANIAVRLLADLQIANVHIRVGDGSYGLPEYSPYEAIIVTANAPKIPRPLLFQLSQQGGRLVLPVGIGEGQRLMVIIRQGEAFTQQKITSVRFVPLIGRFGYDAPPKT